METDGTEVTQGINGTTQNNSTDGLDDEEGSGADDDDVYPIDLYEGGGDDEDNSEDLDQGVEPGGAVSYTHLTLPTTPYV